MSAWVTWSRPCFSCWPHSSNSNWALMPRGSRSRRSQTRCRNSKDCRTTSNAAWMVNSTAREMTVFPTSSNGDDRQLFDRMQAGAPAPANFVRSHRQLKFRPAREQRLQGTGGLDTRELMPETEMDAGTERHVAIRTPLQFQPFGMLVGLRVHVRRDDHRHDFVALLQAHTIELH